jgi:hypothetical protein
VANELDAWDDLLVDARFDAPTAAAEGFLTCWERRGGSLHGAPSIEDGSFGGCALEGVRTVPRIR